MMFRRTKNKEQNPPKQNNALRSLRKKVIIQAVIAVQTIVITLALIFGMSAAWYTNVLQTSGLQFEAEGWGFTGEVLVTEEPIEASPGSNGFIGLTVTNMGKDMVDVALNVSKGQMREEMQQRLFFYVDTQYTRAGESMDRVYINTRDSYTYSVLGYNELVLTKERANDASLKWQWVYDMLGYYFLGTVTQEDAEGTQTVHANITDYLRPVEYDLNKAVFRDGMLESVDGVTTEQLIQQLSLTDGYEKDLIAADGMPGYYKVDVDDSGYGIWVYLCNWAEIQQATTFDSQLGKEAADAELAGTTKDSYIARLTVIGQMAKTESVEITTVEQLNAGLQSGAVMQLQNDLKLDTSVVMNDGAKAVLDLNGHTLTAPDSDSAVKLTEGANLTLMNGNVVSTSTTADAIHISGSSLTLNQVKVNSQNEDGIYIIDENGVENSRIRIFGGEIKAKKCAVFLRGNGTQSSGRSQVFIENSVLESGYIAITGNGNATCWGTEVQIYKSTVTGLYAAVYQPQGDSLTRVVESTLSGITGIVVKGGDLEVVDSVVNGTGAKQDPKLENSGFTDTGDAIYIDCGYQLPINVSVSGNCIITSTNSLAVQVFEPNGEFASVTITGGKFSSDVSQFVPEGYVYYDGTVTQVQEGAGDA